MIVDLTVREVTLLLAFRNEQLQLRLTFVFLELCLGRFRGHEVPLEVEGQNRTGHYTRVGPTSLGTCSVRQITSGTSGVPMQDPCQADAREFAVHRPRVRRPYQDARAKPQVPRPPRLRFRCRAAARP